MIRSPRNEISLSPPPEQRSSPQPLTQQSDFFLLKCGKLSCVEPISCSTDERLIRLVHCDAQELYRVSVQSSRNVHHSGSEFHNQNTLFLTVYFHCDTTQTITKNHIINY